MKTMLQEPIAGRLALEDTYKPLLKMLFFVPVVYLENSKYNRVNAIITIKYNGVSKHRVPPKRDNNERKSDYI